MNGIVNWTGAGVAALATCFLCGAAAAQDASRSTIFSSVRLGVLAHDIGGIEPGPELNAELQFRTPFPHLGDSLPWWISWFTRPRPVIGTDINTAGATSQVYVGAAWTVFRTGPIFSDHDSFFFDAGFAPALNNGYTNVSSTRHKSLGTNLLFRSDAEVGYFITQNISVAAIVEHSSNAGLAQKNPGFTDVGLRIGFGF